MRVTAELFPARETRTVDLSEDADGYELMKRLGLAPAVHILVRGVLERLPPGGPVRDDPPDRIPCASRKAGVPEGVDCGPRGPPAECVHEPRATRVAGPRLGAAGSGVARDGGGPGDAMLE